MNELLKKPAIRIAIFSDIHLGHRHNSAVEITRNLREALKDEKEVAGLDLIILAGDVFDRLLNLPHSDIVEIDRWIVHLLKQCKRHDIALRILEGTPSHDWEQSQRFIDINTLYDLQADVKYFKGMEIEYLAKLDRHLLYIQDQYASSPAKTLEDAQHLLSAKGLTQVDIAVMHGQFEFQVPAYLNIPVHDSEAYRALVREFICIGHDHHHVVKNNIVAQGSFDRIAHGEEEPKGHVRAYCLGDGTVEFTFVENVNAKRFVTVDCVELDAAASLAKIREVVNDLPVDSHIRLYVQKQHPLLAEYTQLIRRFPEFNWSKPKVKKDEDAKAQAEREEQVIRFHPVAITPENITSLLMERLMRKTTDAAVIEQAQYILEELR